MLLFHCWIDWSRRWGALLWWFWAHQITSNCLYEPLLLWILAIKCMFILCVCLREKERETVPQLANEGVVCVCLCVCFARTWLALCLQFEWYHWTPRLFTLHSALCSQVCMRQSLCDQPVVHFTKDGRNVVVEEWNFVLVECVCVSAFVWAVYSMTCWNYVTCWHAVVPSLPPFFLLFWPWVQQLNCFPSERNQNRTDNTGFCQNKGPENMINTRSIES